MLTALDISGALHFPDAHAPHLATGGEQGTQSLYSGTWCQEHPFGVQADGTESSAVTANASDTTGGTDASAATNEATSESVGTNQLQDTLDHTSTEWRVQDGLGYTYHEEALLAPAPEAFSQPQKTEHRAQFNLAQQKPLPAQPSGTQPLRVPMDEIDEPNAQHSQPSLLYAEAEANVQQVAQRRRNVKPGVGHATMVGTSMVYGLISATIATADHMADRSQKDAQLRKMQEEIKEMLQREASLKAEIAELAQQKQLDRFQQCFQTESCRAGGAVTPLAQHILTEYVFGEKKETSFPVCESRQEESSTPHSPDLVFRGSL
mmetsp:Transcript_12982/g.20402  ORF Transcript_12982/g.20402 Transcript_12982/m.20402 type:complete len:320 (-) Transcript_12982:410-1369(-)